MCTESSVQAVCPEGETDSWVASGSVLIRFHSRVPLDKWWGDFESPRPAWALWGRDDLRAKEVSMRNPKYNDNLEMRWNSLKADKASLPVMMTRAARQENKETSKFKRRRLCEKSTMESIQSPKLRAHCSRWSTTPLQKISSFFSGSDLHYFKPLRQWEHWPTWRNVVK